MSIEIVDVYVAYGYAGYKSDRLIGVSYEQQNAIVMAERQGEWGGNGSVVPRKAVVIKHGDNETVFLLDHKLQIPVEIDVNLPEQKNRIKEEALKKLTPVEREVLGLK